MQTGARSFHFALTAVAVISGFVFCNAAAQTYPSKIIRVINPNQPGGNSDIVFRLLSPKMSEILGQQLVVDVKILEELAHGVPLLGHPSIEQLL